MISICKCISLDEGERYGGKRETELFKIYGSGIILERSQVTSCSVLPELLLNYFVSHDDYPE